VLGRMTMANQYIRDKRLVALFGRPRPMKAVPEDVDSAKPAAG